MTVAELQAALSACPPTSQVLVTVDTNLDPEGPLALVLPVDEDGERIYVILHATIG